MQSELYTGVEIGILQLRKTIYFSIIAVPKKSHFNIFVTQSLVQNTHKKNM